MSRNNGTIAGEINHTIHAYKTMTDSEVERVYGVEGLPDGSIFDPTYQMTFDGVCEWATFCVEQDHEEHFESIEEFGGWG